jgi:hypothetical protein
MSIIADRGLFVRLLVQSGRFDAPSAESFADAMDAATREPATKADLDELRADMRLLQLRFDELEKRLAVRFDAIDKRFDAVVEKLFVRMIGVGIAVAGLVVALLRYT